MIDWKAEISRIVSWKQVIAENDNQKAYPWHLPSVAAAAQDIAAAENAAGMAFSTQHKEFLRYADGWQGFLITIDLFGTKDFLDGRAEKVMQREEIRSFTKKLGLHEGEFVPIGASEAELDIFLHISPSAEGLPGGVVWFASEEVDRFESFVDFFAAMVNYNARIAHRVAGGVSLPDMP
ncbi:SMI1/KNR4 family protein [Luteibacter sp. 3190]|uniref:SMI1/KNR4 family protein n=1 Tax=Luteibacter sp. 3190 TaxID=2817736 RepID=UPI0028634B60|nr:SMI1/KNR4 family protein [Luteibacter sp. 3190]MDR6937892.1 hypothetical protein [Luteibacter sp. 3190]